MHKITFLKIHLNIFSAELTYINVYINAMFITFITDYLNSVVKKVMNNFKIVRANMKRSINFKFCACPILKLRIF